MISFTLMSFVCLFATAAATTAAATTKPTRLLHTDDFLGDLDKWFVELENGGTVEASNGKLLIDAPAGCTIWFKPKLDGPVMIEYVATVISAGGKNDRVSDLNCFWMASDERSPQDLFATRRNGKFEDYHRLRCYYVGLGGNGNSTTRFRRYIGDDELRPLLPEHDLRDKSAMIVPDKPQTIRLIADGNCIEYWRDDQRLFEMYDSEPYTSGHFAFRTVSNHMEIRRFRVYRLGGEQEKSD